MLTIEQVADIQAAPNPRFKCTQHRKPWNKAAEWLYQEATRMAENPAEHIKTVEQFASSLNLAFGVKVMLGRDKAIQRGASNVQIATWKGYKGEVIMGINRPNSTEGAAFTVSLKL